MKKKIMLAVATMLMAVVACVSLVACAPSHPVDYMAKFVTSKNFAMVQGSAVEAVDGNKVEVKLGALDTIIVFNKDTVETYIGVGNKWEYAEVPAEGAKETIDQKREECLDEIKELLDSDLFDKAKFDKAYEKKDGYYQTKSDFNITRMKVSGTKLIVEENNGTSFNEVGYLDLGYKISIPSEAKKAKSEWKKNNK